MPSRAHDNDRAGEPDVQRAEGGTVDAALLNEIGTPMIPEGTYAKIINGNA